jgi:serine/threonine protein kinase
VLINSDRLCKVSAMGRDPFARPSKLPVAWMPPETITAKQFSAQSDIWSLGALCSCCLSPFSFSHRCFSGVTIWEIFTLGATPFCREPLDKLLGKINAGVRLPRADYISDGLYSLLMACWDVVPVRRPKADFVLEQLSHLRINPGATGSLSMPTYLPFYDGDGSARDRLSTSNSIGWGDNSKNSGSGKTNKWDIEGDWNLSAEGAPDKVTLSSNKHDWDPSVYSLGDNPSREWPARVYETSFSDSAPPARYSTVITQEPHEYEAAPDQTMDYSSVLTAQPGAATAAASNLRPLQYSILTTPGQEQKAEQHYHVLKSGISVPFDSPHIYDRLQSADA